MKKTFVPNEELRIEPKPFGDQVPSPETQRQKYLMAGVLTNLYSLEFLLRLFLLDGTQADDLTHAKVGDVVKLNALTDYSSLRQLIDRYDAEIGPENASHRVDHAIVEVRDAFAHGRWIHAGNDDWHLVKFEKPRGSAMVKVTFHQAVTDEWLSTEAGRALRELEKVERMAGARKEARRVGIIDVRFKRT